MHPTHTARDERLGLAFGRTSAVLLLTPISSALFAALLLQDLLAPIQLVGAALILVGIAVASGVGRR